MKRVAATNEARIPLHGRGRDNPGDTECSNLFAELERCQAEGLPPPSRVPTAEELAKAIADKKAEDEAQAQREREEKELKEKEREEQQEYDELHDLEMSAMLGGPGPGVSAGPGSANSVSDSTRSLAEDMKRVHFVDSPGALVGDMTNPLAHCTRAVVLIAAPTSDHAVHMSYLDTAQSRGNNVSILHCMTSQLGFVNIS